MPGGGVAAGVLAVSGLNVVVLEKGRHLKEKDFAAFSEAEASRQAYERMGM